VPVKTNIEKNLDLVTKTRVFRERDLLNRIRKGLCDSYCMDFTEQWKIWLIGRRRSTSILSKLKYLNFIENIHLILPILTLALLFPTQLFSNPFFKQEETEIGNPFITVHTSQDLKIKTHCKDVDQDSRGIIYVACSGLLEYDGAEWKIIRHPDASGLFSLKTGRDDKIYVGSTAECGYFDMKNLMPEFVSITRNLPDSVKKNLYAYRILDTNIGIIYQCPGYLIIYHPLDPDSVVIPRFIKAPPKSSFKGIAQLNSRIWFICQNAGLFELSGYNSEPILLDSSFANKVMRDIITIDDRRCIVLFEDGIRLFDSEYSQLPSSEVDDYIVKFRGKYVSKIDSNLFALSTEDGGVALFNLAGRIIRTFVKDDGLPSNLISDRILKDNQGGLWVPTNMGIAYIELNSPFSYYDEKDGLDGEEILGITRFDDNLFCGTMNSLYKLNPGIQKGNFQFVHGQGYYYKNIVPMDGRLMIGNQGGLFELKTGETRPETVYDDHGALSVILTPDSSGLLVGHGLQCRWFKLKNDIWQLEGVVGGIPAGGFDFTFPGDWEYWSIKPIFPCITRLKAIVIPPETIDDFEVVGYDTAEGIPKHTRFGIGTLLNGRRILQTNKSYLEFDAEKDSFIQVDLVDIGEEGEGKLVNLLDEDIEGGVWYKNGLFHGYRYAISKGEKPQIIKPFTRLSDEIVLESRFERDPIIIWFGTESGKLIRYEPSTELLRSETSPTMIRRISAGDGLLYGGGLNYSSSYKVSCEDNNLEISYSIPKYAVPKSNRYQYRLVGYEDEWSSWTDEFKKEYMNLSPGKYQFEVKARDSYGRIAEPAVVNFRIYPPWYQSIWAILVYLIAGGLGVYLIILLRTRQIVKNNIALQKKVDKQTIDLSKTVDKLNIEVVQRKSAEIKSEIHRKHLESIFQGVDEGIVTVDMNGLISNLNRTALVLLSITETDVIGKPIDDTELKLPNEMIEGINICLKSGNTISDFQITYEYSNQKRVFIMNVSLLNTGTDFTDEILVVFRDVTRLYQLEREVEQRSSLGDLLGVSVAMQEIFRMIDDLSDTTATVLIQGETGSGKGMIAESLHKNSPRSDGPLIVVNCAALNDSMLASELFGHVKGAYTGAVNNREGRFQAADNGTLFLDEIGDITTTMQAALLRIIEKGEYERLGESKTRIANARIIAATNRDLLKKAQDGSFREDLYHRLNVVPIYVPPLRQRRDDITFYSEYFLKKLNEKLQRDVSIIAPEAMEIFQKYQWPGNVRELRNVIERAIISCDGDILTPAHLPNELFGMSVIQQSIDVRNQFGVSNRNNFTPGIQENNKKRTALRKEEVESALESTAWNVSEAARRLKITRQHMHKLIKKFDLKRQD